MAAPATHKSARGRPALTETQIGDRRAVITAAARTLFAEEGYAAISIRRIADAAGMTPMTLYTYFTSKADLLRDLWSDVIVDLFDALDEVAELERNPRKRLLEVSSAYVRYWVDHPDRYRMVFMTEGVSQPEVSVFVANDDIGNRFALFRHCIIAATASSPENAPLHTDVLICSLQGIAHNHVTMSGYPWPSPERLVEALVTALLEACRTRLDT
jgi:AcrR family transcriptional regulator